MFTWCQRKFHFYSHSPPITTAVCSLSALPLTFMLLTQRAIRKEKGKKAKSLTSTSFSLDSKQVSCYLVPRFSGCGPWASSIRITLKLVRNAKSWPPPQSSWSRICIFNTILRWFTFEEWEALFLLMFCLSSSREKLWILWVCPAALSTHDCGLGR